MVVLVKEETWTASGPEGLRAEVRPLGAAERGELVLVAIGSWVKVKKGSLGR